MKIKPKMSIHKDCSKDKQMRGFSNYSPDSIKLIVGKMEDETAGAAIK